MSSHPSSACVMLDKSGANDNCPNDNNDSSENFTHSISDNTHHTDIDKSTKKRKATAQGIACSACSDKPKPRTAKNPQITSLNKNIRTVDKENYQLKTHLLALIHDYKSLRSFMASHSPVSHSPVAKPVQQPQNKPPLQSLHLPQHPSQNNAQLNALNEYSRTDNEFNDYTDNEFNDYSTSHRIPPRAKQHIPCVRKRSFHELVDPMHELISNMSILSHNPSHNSSHNPSHVVSPPSNDDEPLSHDLWHVPHHHSQDDEADDVFDFINLDAPTIFDANQARLLSQIEEEGELPDEEDADDDDIDSPALSRSTSPSAMSETDGENSLMTSLTRSTTVSTNNSFMNIPTGSKPTIVGPTTYSNNIHSQPPQFKLYDLPSKQYHQQDKFTFDDLHDDSLSIIQEDRYNMVTDFLEEKLIDNDLTYYVENHHNHGY